MVKYNLNINNVNKYEYKNDIGEKMNSNLNKELGKVVERFKNRVEKEIPDKGYFRNFAENFDKNYTPDFYAKNIALFAQRDEQQDGKAFLGIDVLHPTMNKHMSMYIMNGDRNNILRYLNNNDFIPELEKYVLELSEALKND